MFFIGVFGIEDKEEQIAVYDHMICPTCESPSRMEIYKSYSCFHIFFIPTIKWNTRYFVKSGCCGSIYELDPAIGQEIERGGHPEIRKDHLRRIHQYLPYKVCPDCGSRVESHYHYCPNCGRKFDEE